MAQWTCDATGRLDTFLVACNPLYTRSRIQQLIKLKLVRVNGVKAVRPSHTVRAGDVIVLSGDLPERSSELVPCDLSLPVLYEDDACLVIDKPAGIAVHSGSGMEEDEKTILNGIAFLFAERELPFSDDAVLVHRLDRETTGCLLIAKTREVFPILQKQFEHRTVEKTYFALVSGTPTPLSAIIDSPVGRSLTDRTRMSVHRTSASREAQTLYETLAFSEDASLVACHPRTGRTHQIRVHLHSIGHPILGDPTYVTPHSMVMSHARDIRDLCLHARRLSFESPATKKRVEVTAPVPPIFEENCKKVEVGIPSRA